MFIAGGTVLRDRYVIKEVIAKGGYGYIYLAECLLKKKKYAIKEMLDCSDEDLNIEESIKQFRFEAEILAELNHPQLPKIEDYFEYDNTYFLVMEYIIGNNLYYIVERNLSFLSEEQLLEWSYDLCEVMDYLHSQKPAPIIYRDLKPENIMLSSKNEKLMLIDFGISKVLKKNTMTAKAAKGFTPHFSPPEQYSFTEGTDTSSDIYSLGATIYYLTTRLRPEESIKRLGVIDKLIKPSLYNPHISKEFENIILKAMAINKGDRYQSVKEIKEDLKKITKNSRKFHRSTETDKELKELRKTSEKFRLMVENANDIIATLDNKGNITYITKKVKKLLGLPPEKIIGHHFSEFFPPESALKAYEYFKAPLEGDPTLELIPIRLESFSYNGEKINIEISTSRIYDGNKIISRICVIREITDRVKKEQELVKKLDEFIRFTGITIMASSSSPVKQEYRNLVKELGDICQKLDFNNKI